MSLMDSTCIAIIVILVILIALSAWCSSTETAYSSVNKVRLKNKAEDGNPRAQKALDLLENYDKVLSCILIGNNIVNLTAATLGTVLFTKLLRSCSFYHCTHCTGAYFWGDCSENPGQ